MFLSTISIATLISTVSAAATYGSTTSFTNVDATWYLPAGGEGSCQTTLQNTDMIAALSIEQRKGVACGTCVRASGPKGSVVVKIMDSCESCAFGDMDLSHSAFVKICNESVGRLKISWDVVDCSELSSNNAAPVQKVLPAVTPAAPVTPTTPVVAQSPAKQTAPSSSSDELSSSSDDSSSSIPSYGSASLAASTSIPETSPTYGSDPVVAAVAPSNGSNEAPASTVASALTEVPCETSLPDPTYGVIEEVKVMPAPAVVIPAPVAPCAEPAVVAPVIATATPSYGMPTYGQPADNGNSSVTSIQSSASSMITVSNVSVLLGSLVLFL